MKTAIYRTQASTPTYNVTQIARLLKVNRSRASIIIKEQGWSFTWQGRAKHFDAATVDAYLSTRAPQPEPSGHPQRPLAIAADDDEYQCIVDRLNTRERAEILLKNI